MLRSVRYARNCKFPKKGGFEGWMVMIRIMLTIFTGKMTLTVMTKGGFECWVMMVGVMMGVMMVVITITKGGFEWWMGVVAVLLVLLLAVLIYLGVKAYQRRTANLQAV